MGRLALIVTLLGLVIAGRAETRVSVAQLEQFLLSKQAYKASDAELAEHLNSVVLTEQLTESALRHILARTDFGPRTLEVLELLEAHSRLLETPRDAWLSAPAPPPATQQQMINAVVDYAQNTLLHLPDFVATRRTLTFDNEPQSVSGKHAKPKAQLHFASERQLQITYRDSHEVLQPSLVGAGSTDQAAQEEGFNTWGEFGPILRIVLSDSFKGSVAWSHWEQTSAGVRIAVFRFAVPKPASHYSVDFCCYKSQEASAWFRFRDKPGYHGNLYLDPASGTITGVSLLADFDDSAMVESGLAVDYGPVQIGSRDFICPLHSVAISTIHNAAMKSLDGEGLEKHINEVTFFDYHKFGSTARIVPAN